MVFDFMRAILTEGVGQRLGKAKNSFAGKRGGLTWLSGGLLSLRAHFFSLEVRGNHRTTFPFGVH